VTGKSFDHRKLFIQDRLEFLAGVFWIFGLMSWPLQ
jgi:hypothetical protein